MEEKAAGAFTPAAFLQQVGIKSSKLAIDNIG